MAVKILLDPFYYIEGRNENHKKTPKAPAAPDPAVTAAAQSATNKETAYWNAMLNNVNQYTPYGNIEYTQTGDGTYDPTKPPQFSSKITLNPEQQAIIDSQTRSEGALANLGEQQLGRISQNANTPFSFSGLPDAFTSEDAQTASRRGEEALMSRLEPRFAQDEERLRTRLLNQGIGQGSEAYRREFDQFGQTQNDARMQAILQGANYGGALQDQSLQRRNQGINEYTTQRNAPLNEYIGLTSGVQVQNPSFQNINYGGINPVDYAGLVNQQYQSKLGQYNQKVAGNNATQSGLFSLAGTAAGFLSDPRLKENVVHVGKENGHNIYEFDYKDGSGRFRGVMADQVSKIEPNAVMTHPSGYQMVNYDMLGLKMERVDA
jgi:hypothetical protein